MSSSNNPLRPEPPIDDGGAGAKPQHSSAQGRRLSLCNDVVFKTLFSRHPNLLSDLINAVRHPAAQIKIQRILNPNILPQDLTGKDIILDILAEDDSGQRLGVEMQLQRFLHWPQRNVYGVARSLAGQLQAGEDYYHLKPAIGISLLAHNLFREYPDKAVWHFTLRDTQYPQVQLDQALQVHIIELRKAEGLSELPAPLLAWIACLLHNLDEAAMNEITYPPVKEALKHLETLYSDEELRLMAERRVQAHIDFGDKLDYAYYEGEQKGLQQGQAQLLSRQLERKFGPMPPHYQAQLSQASVDELQNWSLSVLDARHIGDVFAS